MLMVLQLIKSWAADPRQDVLELDDRFIFVTDCTVTCR